MVGQVLGHYRVVEKLGAGGMGVVYRARDLQLGRDVAIKTLPEDAAVDDEARRRLRHEARSLSRLNHPGIETVHELGAHEGREFLVAEYVPGTTLASRIAGGPLPEHEIVEFGAQIAEALSAAHAHGVIHRDLKPANVMITGEGRVKVLDFGLARLLTTESGAAASSSVGAGSIAGTFAYMAPEAMQGVGSEPRSDIYSLGAVLYEMAAGRPPIQAEMAATLVFRVLHEPVTPPRAFRPSLSAELEQLILRCLAKEPSGRPAAAADVARELRRLGEAIATPRPQPAPGPAAATPGPPARTPAPRRASLLPAWWARALLFGAVAAVAALAVIVPGVERLFRPRPKFQPNRVVVAVYVNDTGDRSLDAVGRMAADWITQGLARTGLVEVVPSGIVLQISDGTANADAPGPVARDDLRLGEETAAAIVVSGAYYRQGDSLVFQTRLTDAMRGRMIAALDPVGCPVAAPLEAIEVLRRRVTAGLATRLNPSLSQWSDQVSRPPSIECYREYIEGLEAFVRRRWAQALGHFDRAAAMDPTYYYARISAGLAHLNLGRAAAVDSVVRTLRPVEERLSPLEKRALDWMDAWVRGDLEEGHRVARDMASLAPASLWGYQHGLSAMLANRPREAVTVLEAIDPGRGVYRGWTPYWETLTAADHMLGHYERERREARRGRGQYPEHQSALASLLRAEAALGHFAAVSALLRESATLPSEPGWNTGAMMLFAARELRAHGRRDSSLAWAARATAWFDAAARSPRATEADSGSLGLALYLSERWSEARVVFERLAAGRPDQVPYQGFLGAIAAREGRRDEALARLEALERLTNTHRPGPAIYWQADIAALLGDRARALALLREAMERGQPIFFPMHSDPDLESLRGDTEFRELMRPRS